MARFHEPGAVLRFLAVLGLQPGATMQEVKRAFRRLARGCHPDKFATEPADVRSRAEGWFKRINEAYSWLSEHPEELASAARAGPSEEPTSTVGEAEQPEEEEDRENDDEDEEATTPQPGSSDAGSPAPDLSSFKTGAAPRNPPTAPRAGLPLAWHAAWGRFRGTFGAGATVAMLVAVCGALPALVVLDDLSKKSKKDGSAVAMQCNIGSGLSEALTCLDLGTDGGVRRMWSMTNLDVDLEGFLALPPDEVARVYRSLDAKQRWLLANSHGWDAVAQSDNSAEANDGDPLAIVGDFKVTGRMLERMASLPSDQRAQFLDLLPGSKKAAIGAAIAEWMRREELRRTAILDLDFEAISEAQGIAPRSVGEEAATSPPTRPTSAPTPSHERSTCRGRETGFVRLGPWHFTLAANSTICPRGCG